MGLFKKSKPTDPEEQPIRLSHVVEIQRLLVDISPEAPSGGKDLSGELLALGGGGYNRGNLAAAWTAVVAALLAG